MIYVATLSLPAATCVCPLNRSFILAHLSASSSSALLFLNLAFSAPPFLFLPSTINVHCLFCSLILFCYRSRKDTHYTINPVTALTQKSKPYTLPLNPTPQPYAYEMGWQPFKTLTSLVVVDRVLRIFIYFLDLLIQYLSLELYCIVCMS